MRTVLVWSGTPTVPSDPDGSSGPVWDLVFRPDGSVLAAARGSALTLYDAGNGEIIKQKPAHAGNVYCLAASKDGTYFASGGTDKTVRVWTWELALKYTYTHADSIQALAFNPVLTHVLASCSNSDFTIWTMPSQSLRKIRVSSKILCATWSTDGQLLAIGHANGTVSLRDTACVERATINRSSPVWDCVFNSAPRDRDDAGDTLCLACWDGTLSFYGQNASSKSWEPVGKERALDYDPCSVRPFSSGEYLVVAGSDRKATLITRDGVRLNTIAEAKDWIWRACPRPKSNYVAVAGNDGTVSMHSIVFSTVHGLYQDRYAFRDSMTDVVVQHLVSEQRVRIKCRDYVKKIALYCDRLAVQLPDRINIYELAPATGSASPGGATATDVVEFNMQYRVKDRIFAALECNLLVVTSRNVILCQERKLQLYDFSGVREREWVLEAVIRYIKVVGGPPGKEGLLVGLKNGAVLKIFVDNPFPQLLIKHKTAIRCLDLSMSRRKLAVVDEAAFCVVYDVVTKEALFSEPGANSVAWNSEMEDMLCFSGNGQLAIKTGTFPLHTQRLQGFVVGFTGSKIFCLHSVAMQTIDVPQSASLYRYIESRDWDMAYRVACLGVTESDWRHLGESALKAMQLPIARAAYARLGDMRYLELIGYIENGRKAAAAAKRALQSGDDNKQVQDAVFLAEALAYGGKYGEAAKQHLRGGAPEKAIEMFTDLRLWNEARKFAEETGRMDVNSLMLKQATWCEETGDVKAAATIYSAVGQAPRAVRLLGERGMYNQLIELVRTFPAITATGAGQDDGAAAPGDKTVRDALQIAGDIFRRADLTRFARECFVKLGDSKALLQLHLDAKQWAEALAIATAAEAEVSGRLRAAERAAVGGAAAPAGAAGGGTTAGAAPTSIQSLRKEADAARQLVVMARVAHAEWLASVDRFEEAQKEFEAAARPDLSARILEMLAANAVAEERFKDASYHYLRLALDCAASGATGFDDRDGAASAAKRHELFLHLARLYRAYDAVHEFLTAPFASTGAETIFNAARFVLAAAFGQRRGVSAASRDANALAKAGRFGAFKVSAMRTLYAMAVQGMALQAHRSARFALERCASMLLPAKWKDTVDIASMRVTTKPYSDPEALVPCCYRCGSTMSNVNTTPAALSASPCPPPDVRYVVGNTAPPVAVYPTPRSGDSCISCGHSCVRSMLTFDVLPLVEFAPACPPAALPGLVAAVTAGGGGVTEAARGPALHDGFAVHASGDVQTLTFSAPSGTAKQRSGDPFADLLSAQDPASDDGIVRAPVEVVLSMRPSEVFIVWPSGRPSDEIDVESHARSMLKAGLPLRFFKNVIPDIVVAQCAVCQQFATQQDLEFAVVRDGSCPFCRAPAATMDV